MPMNKNSTLVFLVKNFQPAIQPEVDKCENYFDEVEGADNVPSEETINKILGFARSYDVVETKNTGHIEMILN